LLLPSRSSTAHRAGEYAAGIAMAVDRGWLGMHESGTFLRFTPAGAEQAKGTIKEGAGKLTGDKAMQTEGQPDKAKGSAHGAVGDVNDATRDAADTVRNK